MNEGIASKPSMVCDETIVNERIIAPSAAGMLLLHIGGDPNDKLFQLFDSYFGKTDYVEVRLCGFNLTN